MADNVGYPTILVVYEDQQSRRIHLLLTTDTDDNRVMAATLKRYRDDMNAVHINSDMDLNSILMEVSKVLDRPSKQKKE